MFKLITVVWTLFLFLLYGRFKIQLMLTVVINPIYLLLLNFIWHLCAPLDIFPYNVEQFFVITKDCMSRKNNPLREVGLGQKLIYRTNVSKHFEGLHRQCIFCLFRWAQSYDSFEIKKCKIIYNNRKKPFNEIADCTHGTVVCCLIYPHCNGTWIELRWSLKF